VPFLVKRFALPPGVTPTPLLLGTLEALLRVDPSGPEVSLLVAVIAFVHATVVCVGSPPATSSAGGMSDTGNAVDMTGSSHSSSSSSGGVCDDSGGGGPRPSTAAVSGSPVASQPSTTTSGSSSSSSSSSDQCNGMFRDSHGITIDTTVSSGTGCSSSKDMPTAGHAALLTSLASLAVTLRGALPMGQELVRDPDQSGASLSTTAQYSVPVCCLVAAKLLHLAAQQLAVPGPPTLPALQLAAAALSLAGACAELVEAVCALVVQADELDTTAACILGMIGPMALLWEEVAGMQGAQPWLQQGVTWLSGDAVGSSHKPEAHSRSCSAGEATVQGTGSTTGSSRDYSQTVTNPLVWMARRIKLVCRPRLQLVGCGNLRCTNLSGPSAEGLVAGRKGVVCGCCRVARYCSPACQQDDWTRHRHVCRRLAVKVAAHPGS
jgi:hypothetical protein